MTRNASIADFPEAYQRQIAEKLAAQCKHDWLRAGADYDLCKRCGEHRLVTPQPKPSKYRNVKTAYKSVQGFERVYDSKREAAYADFLDRLRTAGAVKWWLPQVRLPLPGGVVYVADFVVDYGERVAFIDVKGRDTQASINKRKQVTACYGIEVEIIK